MNTQPNPTLDDIWALFRETDRKFQDTDRKFQDTDRKFQESREENERRWQELAQRFQDTDRKFQDTNHQIRELGKQIGGLGNKFGSFTEGLALPSMQKILQQRFGVEIVSPSVRIAKGGQHLEIDVLAYANGAINAAYVVEVKSHLREEHIGQLLDILRRFAFWFPEHRAKALYGILAAVDIPPAIVPMVLAQGLYLARIHDDLFELQVPADFQPCRFDLPA